MASNLSALEKLTVDIQDAGQAWITAKLTADQLSEDAKNLLAAMMNALEAKGDKLSEAKLERLARGSTDYRDYIRNMCMARAEADRKRVRYDALKAYWEAQRSQMAFEREQIAKGLYHQGG